MIALSEQPPTPSSSPILPGAPASTPPVEPAVRRMAASLAHNVNNALTGVIGHLELALRETPPESSLERHLNDSLHGACEIAAMVRRIVGYAFRSSTPPSRELLSLWRTASVAAERIDPEARRRGVAVTLDGQCAGWMRGNARLLQVALNLLLDNALEAMAKGGRLTFRLWEEAGRVWLSLADSGPGLPEETLDRLFTPFFTTKSCGHLGLGLVLCRELVEAQEGSLRVASVAGQGTTWNLSFPLVDAPIRDLQLNCPRPGFKQGYPQPHLDLSTGGMSIQATG
jgi:signal transduction histidine kinase